MRNRFLLSRGCEEAVSFSAKPSPCTVSVSQSASQSMLNHPVGLPVNRRVTEATGATVT